MSSLNPKPENLDPKRLFASGLGFIGFIGFIGFVGFIGFYRVCRVYGVYIGFMRFIGLIGLIGRIGLIRLIGLLGFRAWGPGGPAPHERTGKGRFVEGLGREYLFWGVQFGALLIPFKPGRAALSFFGGFN